MLPDRVSNPGPLTYEPDALPIENCLNETILMMDQNLCFPWHRQI